MTALAPIAIPDTGRLALDGLVAPGQRYLAFVSYRRRDGAAVAQWLRQRIGTFEAPTSLRKTVAEADARVGGSRNRVFLDASYQRSHADFWVDHIAPSVRRSDHLLLLLTPSVFEKLPGGEPNWVEREIETFLAARGDPGRILLVLGPGAPDDRVPDAMAQLSHQWDWADLRFFSTSAVARWRRAALYDAQLTKILARIFEIGDGDLPALTNEFERARTTVHRRIYAAGTGAILGLAALAGWAMVERGRAIAAESSAIEQRDEALRQRNAALRAQSLYLTQTSAAFRDQGSARQAMKLLLPALPDPAHGNDRPLVPEAVVAAYRTLLEDREIGRIALPAGTLAAAAGRDGTMLVAVGPTDVSIVSLPEGAVRRILKDAGGPTAVAEVSPDDSRLVAVGPDGAVRVVDLVAGSVLLRREGLGGGTQARFIDGGRRLALQSATKDRIALVDIDRGTLAERTFKTASTLLTGDDGATLAIVADGILRRLAPADLADAATRPLPDITDVALGKAPGDGPLVLAADKQVLDGYYALLDPVDLTERSRFPLTLGTVTGVSVSRDGKTIAVHTPPNITFFDTTTGHALSNEPSTTATGRFVGEGTAQDYAVAENGNIKVFVPGRNLATRYKSEDEAEMRDLVWDKGDLGFTSITATPVVTRWSFKDASARRHLRLHKVIKALDFPDWPPLMAAGAKDGERLAVSYLDGSVAVWDLRSGTVLQTIEPPAWAVGETSDLVLSPDETLLARAEGAGRVVIYDLVAGTSRLLLAGDKPTFRMQFVGRRLAVEPKGADIVLLDLAGSSSPRSTTALAGCRDGVARKPGRDGGGPVASGAGTAAAPAAVGDATLMACVADGSLRVVDVDRDRLLWTIEAPPAATTEGAPSRYAYAFMPRSDRIATVDGRGMLSVRSASTGRQEWSLQLTATLGPEDLLSFRDSPLLDAEARATVRSGAQTVAVKLPAVAVLVSPDERRAAVFFPDRSVQVVDLAAHAVEATLRPKQVPIYMDFSRNCDQMAIVEAGSQSGVGGELQVYDFNLKRLVSSTTKLFSAGSQVFHVGNGEGFVTLIRGYELSETPMFERTADLVADLTHRYPERLTPEQRHVFSLD